MNCLLGHVGVLGGVGEEKSTVVALSSGLLCVNVEIKRCRTDFNLLLKIFNSFVLFIRISVGWRESTGVRLR